MTATLLDSRGTPYRITGAGASVLLIHGVGLDQTIWDGVVRALAPGYRLITYDMLGHGAAPLPPPDVGIGHYATQAVDLLDHLGIPACAVVGFSMGALVGQALAVSHPARVARFAFVSGVYDRSPEQRLAVRTRALEIAVRGVESMIDGAMERWLTPAFRARNPEVVQAIAARMRTNDPVGYLRSQAVFATADEGLAATADAIRCPTLVLTAEHDAGSTPDMAVRLSARIAGSRAVILRGLRHLLPIEAPDALAHELDTFLRPGALEEAK
jgi:pimeloyl-ACP methyl ester carboxylesterase